MKIKVSKLVAEALGETKLRALGQEIRNSYRDHYTIDLASLTAVQVVEFRSWLEDLVKIDVRGPKTLLRDLDTWKAALSDAGKTKARTLQHFSGILTEYLRKMPGHRLYRRLDMEGLAHVAFYVNEVKYHPEHRDRDHYSPAFTSMQLMNIELGGRVSTNISFRAEDAQGKTPSEALVLMGYFPETEELRSDYLAQTDRFNSLCESVGLQFAAVGTGTDDLDGNKGTRWSGYSGRGAYPMERNGVPAKVVIDVFQESEKESRHHDSGHLDMRFWARSKPNIEDLDYDDDFLEATEEGDIPIEEVIEVPVHPFCATFDLRRHLRLKIHVNYLTEYVYDETLGDRLILPPVVKNLVSTLISQNKIDFEDIVADKGGGVCVLLTGEPGVGKTLTAEVFAESSKRPLYSVQAAQLGMKAEHVEENLMRFLARGSRWNAVVLIDEADVYIRARDRDMEHNAIVASFLRVLEYQSSVLFMTTNLPDLVDDAIASRCVARIDYQRPGVTQQQEIWQVLNEVNDTGLTASQLEEIVAVHDNLTGRDIKQLLKLASLVSANHGTPITPGTIDFVSQFQPTKRELSSAEGGEGGFFTEFHGAFDGEEEPVVVG